MNNSKTVRLIFITLFVAALAGPAIAADRQKAFVTEVVSGDTVKLRGGKTLKYANIQAPPLQSKLPAVRAYGEASLAFNKSLVDQKEIEIEWGNRLRDEQNNLLGFVFLGDGRFVNLEMLKAGHARSTVKAPNLKYAADFRKSDMRARRGQLGLWKGEPDNPYIRSEYIGEKNTKIYYFPTSPELERIPQAQLITFRSRVEAKAAGYRPCGTCHEGEDDERFS